MNLMQVWAMHTELQVILGHRVRPCLKTDERNGFLLRGHPHASICRTAGLHIGLSYEKVTLKRQPVSITGLLFSLCVLPVQCSTCAVFCLYRTFFLMAPLGRLSIYLGTCSRCPASISVLFYQFVQWTKYLYLDLIFLNISSYSYLCASCLREICWPFLRWWYDS